MTAPQSTTRFVAAVLVFASVLTAVMATAIHQSRGTRQPASWIGIAIALVAAYELLCLGWLFVVVPRQLKGKLGKHLDAQGRDRDSFLLISGAAIFFFPSGAALLLSPLGLGLSWVYMMTAFSAVGTGLWIWWCRPAGSPSTVRFFNQRRVFFAIGLASFLMWNAVGWSDLLGVKTRVMSLTNLALSLISWFGAIYVWKKIDARGAMHTLAIVFLVPTGLLWGWLYLLVASHALPRRDGSVPLSGDEGIASDSVP